MNRIKYLNATRDRAALVSKYATTNEENISFHALSVGKELTD